MGKFKTQSTGRLKQARRTAVVWGLVAGVVLIGAAGHAAADSTHKFLFEYDTPSGTQPQPMAVDSEGNLYVYNEGENTISKYRPDLATHTLVPVEFSALASNVLDGHGFGEDCPATPDDCDRTPANGFGQPENANDPEPLIAVDISSGPAAGYIYVSNPAGGPENQGCAHPPPCHAGTLGSTDVFAPSGRYVGQIDKSVDGPTRTGSGSGRVSVSANGHVFIGDAQSPSVIDEFVPIDGDPEHDVFRGQIFTGTRDSLGDTLYSYFQEGFEGWRKVPYSQYTARHNAYEYPEHAELQPGEQIFGSGGLDPEVNSSYTSMSLDPLTHDIYLGDNGRISEWSAANEPIGPVFGPPYASEVKRVAVDDSGSSTNGIVYTHGAGNGGDQIAVFSPPIPLPAIDYETPAIGHKTAHLVGDVKLDGGPEVTSCELQWGSTLTYGNLPAYERKPVPCAPATPYGADQQVTADLSSLQVEQEYHYRFVVKTANGEERGRDRSFRTAAVLGLTTEAPTDVTKTSAVLNGSLNPDNLETTFHYEYGATTEYGLRTPEETAPAAATAEALPPEPLTGLQPGRRYHVRLVASNELGRTVGADQVLQMADRPSVFAQSTSNVLETSADLQAKVNPLGYDTTYRFEYGTSVAYGTATSDVDLGASAGPHDVEVQLSELVPGVTYHFRVVATNEWGTTVGPDTTFGFAPPTCPNAHIRQETEASYLPDCRAYELVTPEEAQGGQVVPGDSETEWWKGAFLGGTEWSHEAPQNAAGLAVGPSRFAYYAAGPGLEGQETPNTTADLFVSTRTPTGWVNKYVGVPSGKYFGGANPQCAARLDRCLEYPTLGGPGGSETRQDNVAFVRETSNGRSVGRLPSNYATVPDQHEFWGAGRVSADFSHYAFSSLSRLFAVGGTTAEPGSVYDNDLNTDTVQVVSLRSNGSAIPSEPGAKGTGAEPKVGNAGPLGKDFLEVPSVSRDGSHILIGARVTPRCSFALPEEALENYECGGDVNHELTLYMRVDDRITYEVSDGHPVVLLGMTGNGATVYFSTPLRLTGEDTDSSVDIYRWSEPTNELTLVSKGGGQGNGDNCSATWTAKCDVVPLTTCTSAWIYRCNYQHQPGGPTPFISERPEIDSGIAENDGAILFEAPEQLDATNPGVPNERNLYELRDGSIHYITTFDPGSETRRFNISPDGRYVAFLTNSRLTTYDNTSTATNRCGGILGYSTGTANTPCEEMYRYDASSEEVLCVSCDPTGAPPAGDVTASESGLFMSNDGRVFFDSPDALSPRDTNGHSDVYEYVDGRPQLISSGTGDQDVFPGYEFIPALGPVYPAAHIGLESVSADGEDVYFSTYQTLVPQDHNGNFLKVYDARTAGGIPFTPPQLPCPAADECHGEGSVPSEPPQIGTGAPLGVGRSAVRHRALPGRHRRHKGKHVRRRRHERKTPRAPHRGGSRGHEQHG